MATSWEFRRRPWVVKSGGPGSRVWKTTDGGDTWREITAGLPALKAEGTGPIEDWFYTTQKGISIPWFFPREAFWQWMVFVIGGAIAARWAFRWRVRVLEETGHEAHAVGYSLVAFLLFAVVGWFAHPIAGALGWIFGGLAWVFGNIPTLLMQSTLRLLSRLVTVMRRLNGTSGA